MEKELNFQVPKPFLIVGIDTGVNTGIAFWNQLNKEFDFFGSVAVHRALNMVFNNKDDIKLIRVEDARLRKYITGGREKLQGAGSIKRDAKIWEDFLTDHNIPFELVAPKNNKTKLSATVFKKITAWHKSTNQHSRDAAMLVFNWNK